MARYLPEIILKNEKKIILRNLELSDSNNYINFCKIIGSETAHTLHYPNQILSIDAISEKLKISIDSPFQLELGGFCNEILISHLTFYKPRPYHPFEKHIGEFGIKIVKNFSCMGLGSTMMLIMENIARQMGISRIQAKVRTSNYIGINFYRKLEYQIEGVKKQAALINGLYEDEFYIAKILN